MTPHLYENKVEVLDLVLQRCIEYYRSTSRGTGTTTSTGVSIGVRFYHAQINRRKITADFPDCPISFTVQ